MKKFLYAQIPTLIVGIYILILHYIFGYQFQNFSDNPGHITQAISTLYDLDMSIYSFKTLVGYFPILYPPFTFLIYEILKNIFQPTIAWVSIFFLVLPFFSLALYKICSLLKVNYFIFLILSLFCLTTSFEHESMMIFTGSNPAFMGVTAYLWIIYLFLSQGFTKRNTIIYALLTSIIVLSHTISASVVFIAFLIISIWLLTQKKFKEIVYILFIGLLSFITCIIWIVPFLEFNSEVARNTLPGYSSNTYIFIFLLISSLAILKFKTGTNNPILREKTKLVGIIAIILIAISLLPEIPILSGLHMYRYFIYGLLIIIPQKNICYID